MKPKGNSDHSMFILFWQLVSFQTVLLNTSGDYLTIQELENYEALQQRRTLPCHQKSRMTRGGNRRGSDLESVSDNDITSDEESLGQRRSRQAKLVRRSDTLMHKLIARDREKNKLPKQWAHLEGEFKHRQDSVEDTK